MKSRVGLFLLLVALVTAAIAYHFAHPHSPAARAPRSSPLRAANGPGGSAVHNTTNAAASSDSLAQTQAAARERDPVLNPYASALHEPGKSKRTWDPAFLKSLQHAASGDPIQFELTDGRNAVGTIRITQMRNGELVYLSGELTEPEQGKFFFLKPPPGGKAGKAVGVVEFPTSRTAYRIEPTGPNGEPELWQRRLDEVVCLDLPVAENDSTNIIAQAPPLRPDAGPDYVPSYNSNIVSLQSYPGSSAVLLLDFFGGYTPTWGGIAYSRPANVNNSTIKDLWKRVAEDYMGFNINVTTDIRVYLAAPAASRQRCCFTDTPVTAAGVAYIGSWNWGNDTPCWSVYNSGKNGAEVGAHEPGHTLGLGHQGSAVGTNVNEYYLGQGSGPTGWAPIMGAGYYQPVSTWAKGEYLNANNSQDELYVITTANNNVTYRPDDTGSTLATSRYLELYPDGSAYAEGAIERTGDTDAFQFSTGGGQISLTAAPVGDWANLAVSATLADSTDSVIASNNPQSILSATITTTLPAGTYTFRVTGAGRNSPLTNGFSAYASLGYYSIAGWVSGARLPTRLTVLEHSAIGTMVGVLPTASTNDPLACAIVSGNTGGTFAIDTNGVLQVVNNTLLDYNRLATNTMFPVQFQLLVNLTNLANPTLTELNRRVVVAVLKQDGNYPIAVTGFNASVIAPWYATATTPRATGFDIANNYSLYEAGLNGNAQAGGSGAMQGLPPSGRVVSQEDGSTFQLAPYGSNNVLLLGYTYPSSGTLTLATPQAYDSLSILASSANGGGNGTFYLRFTNGSISPVFTFNAQDWYNTITNVAAQGFGRLKLAQATLSTEYAGWNNPNLYSTTIDLASRGLNLPIASITFTKPGGGTTLNSGVFALSGNVMAPQVAITQQPKSTTNNVPAASATFSVVAMGAAPLSYQWYYSPNGTLGSFTALSGQNAATLTLNPELQISDAGSFYVVITNSISAATSAVASLTVLRAPVIAQQPTPPSRVLLSGASTTLSVSALGALPLWCYWTTNGALVPGGTGASLSLLNAQVGNSGNYSVIVSNAYGVVTSSVVSVSILPPASYPLAQAVQQDHPLAYWRLNETSGTTAYDCISGMNGTYNRVLLGQPGYNLVDTHKSARFGYLSANTSMVTNIPINFATAGSAAFSVEAWVNGGPQNSDNGLVTKGTGSGGEQFNLDCGGPNHAFRFFVRDITGATHGTSSSQTPDNRWHHLVAVCDEPHGTIYLYVDGTNCPTASIVAGSGLLASANLVSIGCRQSGTATYDYQFAGLMEEVAIYNYALSAAQVQAHYGAATNRAPTFVTNPFTIGGATATQPYAASLTAFASDPNGDSMTFAKLSGPAWLTVASAGGLSGTPLNGDIGTNSFLLSVTDPYGLSSTAVMNMQVSAIPPIVAQLSPQGSNLLLSWTGGIAPYQVWVSTNHSGTAWQPLGAPLTTPALLLAPSNGAAFFRIQGQ